MKTANKVNKNPNKQVKILYIEAKSKAKPECCNIIDNGFIARLPKDIFLAYSIQFKGKAEQMKKALEANNIHVRGFQQVLGCTKLKTPYTIVLAGSGKFHALNLALQNKKPVILYSNGSSILVGAREIEEHKKKVQAGFSMFLHAGKIGLLVSAKPGQENLSLARKLKEKIMKKYPEKKAYIFISSSISISGLENFNIPIFISTACPGIALDSPKIINADDARAFLR